jgi:hypothetical protein
MHYLDTVWKLEVLLVLGQVAVMSDNAFLTQMRFEWQLQHKVTWLMGLAYLI